MLARIWRTRVDPERLAEYERFARERSLPMFRQQRGILEVLFLREAADRAAVLTLWEDERAAEELETSPIYRQTVAAILAGGFLVGSPSIEVFHVTGGELWATSLATAIPS